MRKKSARKMIITAIPYVLLTAMLAISLIPLVSMLGTSFRSRATLLTTRTIFPKEWSLEFYRSVLSDPRIVMYFKNSFVNSFITCIVTVFCSVLGGYALSRFGGKVKGITIVVVFLLMLQMFPTVQMIIPLYITFQNMKLINTPFVLLACYPAFTLPMNMWMMRSFIDSVPYEMEEAGRIDGCNRFQTITRIVVPVSKPGIASSAILAFNHCWNEFLLAMILIKKDNLRTMPVGLNNYMQENAADWGSIMAAATLMLIPVLLFLNVLQKNIVGGLTVGSVKG